MEHMHSHGGLIDHLLEEPLEGLLNSIGLAEKLNHFIVHALMDFLEISLLLLIVVTLVTYLQTYIPFDKMRRKLQKLRGLPGMLLALVLGALSPFCSCTIIPILMGFLAAGVPLSCCLVFLTSASCLNITALSTIFATFDLKFALAYTVSGLAICILSATLLSATHSDRFVRLDKLQVEHHHHHDENSVGSRLKKAICSAGLTYKSMVLFLLIGVLLSAALESFVPQGIIERTLTGAWALPLATIVGGCLHSDVFSILPIVQTAYAYSPAVALNFLLSVMLFSIAEWALLSQAFRGRLIARYCLTLLGLALAAGVIALFLF